MECELNVNDVLLEEVNLEFLMDLVENFFEDDKKYVLGLLCNYCIYCKVSVVVKLDIRNVWCD